jgi:CMP-N-acetylneuraminic acid synthetase
VIRSEKSVGIESINQLAEELKDIDTDYFMFLNPCHAFLKTETVLCAIAKFNESSNDYLEAVIQFNMWLYDEEKLITELDFKNVSTKYCKTYYRPAHAFRIFPKKQFIEEGIMASNNPILYEISEREAIDVDTEQEFRIMVSEYGRD